MGETAGKVAQSQTVRAGQAAGHERLALSAGEGGWLTLSAEPRQTLPAPLRPSDRVAGLRRALQQAALAERSRGTLFLFFPVALGVGAGLWLALPQDPPLAPILAGFLGLAAVAARAHRLGRPLAGLWLLAAAAFAGAGAAALEAGSGPVLLDSDVTTTVTGRVVASDTDDAARVRYLLDVEGTADPVLRRPPGRIRLVARGGGPPVPVGARLSGRARLSSPSGPALPGGYDFAFTAFSEGIGAYGFFFGAPQPLAGDGQARPAGRVVAEGVTRLRAAIAARIRKTVPGDAGAIAAALTVSDRRGISAQVVEDLRATGLAHILAISGLHMALAAGLFYVGLRRVLALMPTVAETVPVKKIAAFGALVVSTAYLVISGAAVPTQRAWLMMVVLLVAVLLDRAALTMRNVAVAAIAVILVRPSAVVTPGFQMSFAATSGLIAAYDFWARRMERRGRGEEGWLLRRDGLAMRLGRAVAGLAATSLVAGLATGLFSAHHFHRIAAYGLLANLGAMPLVTFVVMPAGLVAMLAMPFGLDALPLKAMGRGIEGVIAVAGRVSALGGDVTVGLMPLPATVTAAAGFILLVFLRGPLRLAGGALLFVGLALAAPPFRPPPPDLVISEDGRLVGLLRPGAIATNAARPGRFVFEQWQAALRRPRHEGPTMVATAPPDGAGPAAAGRAVSAKKAGNADKVPREPGATGADLAALLRRAATEPDRFFCRDRKLCAASRAGLGVLAIADPALIAPACDRADLVIVARPVRIDHCRSGATLVTAATLRRTGALAIRILPVAEGSGRDEAAGAAVHRAFPGGGDRGPVADRPRLLVVTALGGIVRPWTIQRFYDWRTGRFDLPENASPAEDARVVAAPGMSGGPEAKPPPGQGAARR